MNFLTVRRLAYLFVFVALFGAASAQAPQANVPAQPAARVLETEDAIVLGVVEGVTEFLPVSSTGHLILANHFLGLDSEEIVLGSDGQPLWAKKPSESHPNGRPMTVKELADAYSVIIQVGAILAVVFLYGRQIGLLFQGLMGRSVPGFRLLRNVLLAFLPAAGIGFVVHDWIDENLFSVQTVAIAGFTGAILMFYAEKWRKDNSGPGTSRLDPTELTAKQALSVGLMQCLALWPGTSRSMVTMVGGYFIGLSPAKAAEFSFLVGLPTLAGAAFLKAYKTGPAIIEAWGPGHVLLGIAVAAVSAALAVRLFVSYLTRHGLIPFAIYRIGLAVVLLLWFYF